MVMPYAIIGIISLGLVITSIRTVVVERAHIRKKLVGLMVRRHQKRLNFLKRRTQQYQARFPRAFLFYSLLFPLSQLLLWCVFEFAKMPGDKQQLQGSH